MNSFVRCLTLSSLFSFTVISTVSADVETLTLQRKTDIKAVYQVSDATEHEGFSKGLFYARKLLGGYKAQGVDAGEIDLHLVYHSGAIPALLKDAAYQRLTGKSAANPNASLITELIKAGIHIEICGDTMRQKNVKSEDLLPGVKIVPGAFPRLIDLQLAGYPYIKFE